MKTIVFVCHGNICRSPAAEFIALDLLVKRGTADQAKVFSRATSLEEIGNDVYPPMKRALAEAGIPYFPREAKRLSQAEYDAADIVYYMDELNLRYLSRIIVDRKRILRPITALVPDINEIEDPWYSGRYELVIRQIRRCVTAILDDLNL